MTPAGYEALVGEFVREISAVFGDMTGATPSSGSSNRIKGASGYTHQIDVSLTVGNWLVLVECKRWRKRVGVAEVLVLASRAADVKATRPDTQMWVALVTQEGASANALRLASHFNISVDRVRSPHEYSLRLRSQVNVGVADGFCMGDHVTAEVVRFPKSDT